MRFGMFGDDVGYMSSDHKELSEEMKAKIDDQVKKILQESEERVEKLLLDKGPELRSIAWNLYWYDYLDEKEMELIYSGKELDKERVREWTPDDKPDDSSSNEPLIPLQS